MRVAQLAREPGAESAAMVLTPDQQSELAQANRNLLDMRRELRQVQFRLREEIDALGLRVLVANVILWPALVAGAALVWYLLRGRTAR
jgi:fructoselysine-6-P-deglycase FrlB-like protein